MEKNIGKVSFAKIGWTISSFFIAFYLICIGWDSLLTDPALKTLHQQLLALGLPGFTWLSFGSLIWGLFLSFVYGWIVAAIFIWFKRRCCDSNQK